MGGDLTAVFEAIDTRRRAAEELLAELVRVNSVNPEFAGVVRGEVIGGETRCNEILAERFGQAGLELHWVAEDPERRNLVGHRAGSGGGRSLALNGHVDTVPPVEPDSWISGSPWKPEVRDGRLYGIGSTDMKAAVSAMWLVAQALEDTGAVLKGDLQLHSVIGEETMQHELGTSACIEAGFRTDAAVVCEPTSVPRPLTISPVAAGNWYFRIRVQGKSTHCGNRAEAIRPGGRGDAIGVNALEKGVKVVGWLQDLETQWGMTKTHPYFMPGFFSILPGVFYSDPGLDIPFYFANHAEIAYSLWYPPDEDRDDVVRQVQDHVLGHARHDPWLRDHPPEFEWINNWPPATTPWEDPIVQAMVGGHELASNVTVLEPSPQTPVAFGAASDASFYEAAGVPAVVYGPGELRLAHSKDESVALDELTAAAKGLAACVWGWCDGS